MIENQINKNQKRQTKKKVLPGASWHSGNSLKLLLLLTFLYFHWKFFFLLKTGCAQPSDVNIVLLKNCHCWIINHAFVVSNISTFSNSFQLSFFFCFNLPVWLQFSVRRNFDTKAFIILINDQFLRESLKNCFQHKKFSLLRRSLVSNYNRMWKSKESKHFSRNTFYFTAERKEFVTYFL